MPVPAMMPKGPDGWKPLERGGVSTGPGFRKSHSNGYGRWAGSGRGWAKSDFRGAQRHILHGYLLTEAAVKNSLTRLSRQGLTHSLLLARLLVSGLWPATVQPALPILLAGLTA